MHTLTRLFASLGLSGLSALSLAAVPAAVDPHPPAWPAETQMKQSLRQAGYTIKRVTVVGACYEIDGWDRTGTLAEVYFNPVDGSVVRKG